MKFRSFKSWKRGIFRPIKAAIAGFTLVELLVYILILSLVSIGVTRTVIDIQRANVVTTNLAEQLANADLALRRVQVKLGNSDAVEVSDRIAGSGKKDCLRLKSIGHYERSGFEFNGRNQYLRTANIAGGQFNIFDYAPRSISVWIKPLMAQSGRATIVQWGQGAHGEFGLQLVDGQIMLDFNCARYLLNMPIDLRDGNWHHIVVTFQGSGTRNIQPNDIALNVNGRLIPGTFTPVTNPNCPGNLAPRIRTAKTSLFVGRHYSDYKSGFEGLISDLRIWSRRLSLAEITALVAREQNVASLSNQLNLHWALDIDPPAGYANGGSWAIGNTGMMMNFGPSTPLRKHVVDDPSFHSFCFIDDDADQLYTMWESATAKAPPSGTGQSAAQTRTAVWEPRSDDIFVPSANGFFEVFGSNPETVIANFAVGKGIADGPNVTQKTQSRTLASTRTIKRLELCRIDAKPKISSPTCTFSTAFVAVENYQGIADGYVDILFAKKSNAGGNIVFSDLPNMPTTVTGTWYPKLGVLKFQTNDGKPIATKLWARVMGQVLYRPKGSSAETNKTFTFGVGALPFFENNDFRMYDFVDKSTQVNNFNAGLIEAAQPNPKFCGMTPHMLTITSQSEQDHLEKVMMTRASPGWMNGWIAAKSDGTATFSWKAGPENYRSFWKGDGINGLPYDAITGIQVGIGGRRFFEYDQYPTARLHIKRVLVQPTSSGRLYRYTNWAGGSDFYSCDSASTSPVALRTSLCQPATNLFNSNVAIHGDFGRSGTWMSTPQGEETCVPGQHYSVCGYYREFASAGKATDALIAHRRKVNMARFREFCLAGS
ncbi:LamG domain-containing protein [SAR116 cluster bacterium]|nr:LamG domain-containing protein [SAR116 cluster bacterium]